MAGEEGHPVGIPEDFAGAAGTFREASPGEFTEAVLDMVDPSEVFMVAAPDTAVV